MTIYRCISKLVSRQRMGKGKLELSMWTIYGQGLSSLQKKKTARDIYIYFTLLIWRKKLRHGETRDCWKNLSYKYVIILCS